MNLAGEVALEVDLKCPADKIWEGLCDFAKVFLKSSPDLFKNCKILEGDGKAVGSLVVFHVEEEIPHLHDVKVRVVEVNDEKKMIVYEYLNCDSVNLLKAFKGKDVVVPKENGVGCIVKWSAAYEPVGSHVVPLPNFYSDFAKRIFLELDAYLLNN